MLQGPADWNPAPKKIKEACKKAVEYAADQGIELPELAIKATVASNPDITTHLVFLFDPSAPKCGTLICEGLGQVSKLFEKGQRSEVFMDLKALRQQGSSIFSKHGCLADGYLVADIFFGRTPYRIFVQIGCCTPEEVMKNVSNVLEAFSEPTAKESEVLKEVKKILQPIQGQTWPSGLPNNN